jgi:hypothetical protein
MQDHPPPHKDTAAALPQWIDTLPFLLFGVFLWLILHHPTQINHDCAYVLQCSQILTMGGLPYVDFIDVNPPLIFYLNTVPVYAAQAAGWSLPETFSLFVLALLAGSTLFLAYLFRLPELNLKPAARFALLLGWILCSLYVYATGDFGQRDYLVILAVFPFVLIRIIRYYGDTIKISPAILIGLLTGIGLSLKPNFLFMALLPELIALARTKRFRVLFTPEIYASAAFCILYAVHFFFLPAIVRTELFGRWVPFFMRYYGTVNLNLFQHVFMQPMVIAGMLVLCSFIVLAFIVVRRRGMTSLRIEILAGLVIGSFLSYWIQQKGYSYHSLPAKISFIMLMLFISLWLYEEVMHRKEHVPFRRVMAAVSAVMILAALAALSVRSLVVDQEYVLYQSFEPYRDAIRAHSAADDRVLFINTVLFPAYPTLVQTGRLSASRYLTSFPLAGFYYGTPGSVPFSYRPRRLMTDEEQRFLRELASDIRINRPALIFIHDGEHCSALPDGFNMLEYFRKADFIADAMRSYERSGTVGEFALYLRK